MARTRDRTHSALYYPLIEVEDPGWLLSAALFWETLSTITPDTDDPYHCRASRVFADEGVLIPHRVTPKASEVKRVATRIAPILSNPTFSLIDQDHWSMQQV